MNSPHWVSLYFSCSQSLNLPEGDRLAEGQPGDPAAQGGVLCAGFLDSTLRASIWKFLTDTLSYPRTHCQTLKGLA